MEINEIEIAACAKDFFYFAKNYVKVADPRMGLVPFAVHNYHERVIDAYSEPPLP